MSKRFILGKVVVTPGYTELFADPESVEYQEATFMLLAKHVTGDPGVLDPEDVQANEDALETGARIFSAYSIESHKVWVITEADRSVTTLLLPEEY